MPAGTKASPSPPTIHQIIARGDLDAFSAWLEQAGNPDLPDPEGLTPLHTAVMHRQAEMAAALLEQGADPAALTREGLSAYDLAVMSGQTETARLLEEGRTVYRSVARGEAAPPEPEQAPKPVAEVVDVRTWTSASGRQIEAAFVQCVLDNVILQKRDGELARIPLNHLDPKDQALARRLSGLEPHALARTRPARIPSARQRSSIALNIGKSKDWTIVEDCRLVNRRGNDGDSFHVRHEGKEYIFRLYFVDAPETATTYPTRVREQADYFGLDKESTLVVGKEARKFTTGLLAATPFTVVTKWEDARGNSRLPRHYAMVVTSMGDLDELLVREGLVRRYGMIIKGGEGRRKSARLKELEAEARREKAGAWAISRDL